MLGTALLALALAAAPEAGALRFASRGVYTFDSGVPCPLAGLGERGPNACNRVTLDDSHTAVLVEPAAKRITFTNTTAYAKETLVGDVLLLGKADALPVGVHLKVFKQGRRISTRFDVHRLSTAAPASARFDSYTVWVDDGSGPREALEPAHAMDEVLHPALADRLAGAVFSARDNLPQDHDDPAKPGYHLGDITVTLGLGPLATDLIRAEVVLSHPIPPGRHTLPELLASSEGELRLTGLSSLLPRDLMTRALWELGIDTLPSLQGVARDGLGKGQTIVFTMRQGTGEARVGEQASPMPGSLDVARGYMEFDYLGAGLAMQARGRLEALGGGSPVRAP